jgi:hypothetical protein
MATHLYLRDLDPVSVRCLANAGCELIKLYAKKLRGKAILSTPQNVGTRISPSFNSSASTGLRSSTRQSKANRMQNETMTGF